MCKLKILLFMIAINLSLCDDIALAQGSNYLNIPPEKMLMLRYKSTIDNSSQPLLIKTPAEYSTDKTWPLLVVLHGLGDGPLIAPAVKSMIQIGPFARGDKWYEGIAEKEVFESIKFVKTIMPVDQSRVYLAGFSMGGYGTFRLASRFPDYWAACVPVCARVPQDFELDNCSNLPFWIHTGKEDYRVLPEPCVNLYSDSLKFTANPWRYADHKQMGHSFDVNWKDVENWLLQFRKPDLPKEISYTTNDPLANHAYWLKIEKMINPEKPAFFKGKIDKDAIRIFIDNISSLKIDFSSCIVENDTLAKPIIIEEHGKVVFKGEMPQSNILIYNRSNN